MRERLAVLMIFLLGCTMPGWECSKDSDCPQPLCAGMVGKCDFGRCVTLYSNGTLANCTNTALPNPAAEYCIDKGYRYEIDTSPNGSQTGYCYIPTPENNWFKCEEWSFYRGECPTCKAFCNSLPHIECVGYWNITGEFPNCVCQYICSTAIVCSSNSDCPKSYVCYNSRRCSPAPEGVIACGDQEGDLLCHKKCETNYDCPSDMPYCRTLSIFQGDVGSAVKMCMEEECKTDSDCPQYRCPGVRSICVGGECKVVDSNGAPARCAEEMSKELCERYGGHWNECGSACAGEPPGTVCIAVCVPQCECGGSAGWSCPPGYYCKLSGRDEVGVCKPS